MGTVESAKRVQFRWCGRETITLADGRLVVLPRKATALLAYLCLEAGPHTRGQLATMLWPDSDDAHAAMSLRQALSKLREVLGDAIVADRQQVRLQHERLSLERICDVHQFEALLASDPRTACTTDVHRFLDTLVIDDAPAFVHWGDRTRARLIRSAVAGLQRCAAECRAQHDWRALREVAERWLTVDPLSVDAACEVIEAAYLTRDAAAALAQRAQYLVALERADLDDASARARIDQLVARYDRFLSPTPARGMAMVTDAPASTPSATRERPGRPEPVAWHDVSLSERGDAWRTIVDAFASTPCERNARWITLAGGIGSGRSRLLRDVLTLLVERGATVMSALGEEHGTGAPYASVARLIRSILHEDALAGVDERSLRTMTVLVPELADVFPALRRSGAGDPTGDGPFAVRLQEALVQVCVALTEQRPLVIALDDAMAFDRDSTVALLTVSYRLAELPVLWLATDADDAVQLREAGDWGRIVHSAPRVALPPLSPRAIEGMLADVTGVSRGWESLAARVHACAHGRPGAVADVLQRLESTWGAPAASWQRRPVQEVPVAAIAPRLCGHADTLEPMARTMLLALAILVEDGHPVSVAEWRSRPVLTPDDLSHILGISRLRAAVLGEHLVECRLALEDQGGFRCASPMVAAHALGHGSDLVRDEVRRLVHTRRPAGADGDAPHHGPAA